MGHRHAEQRDRPDQQNEGVVMNLYLIVTNTDPQLGTLVNGFVYANYIGGKAF